MANLLLPFGVIVTLLCFNFFIIFDLIFSIKGLLFFYSVWVWLRCCPQYLFNFGMLKRKP